MCKDSIIFNWIYLWIYGIFFGHFPFQVLRNDLKAVIRSMMAEVKNLRSQVSSLLISLYLICEPGTLQR